MMIRTTLSCLARTFLSTAFVAVFVYGIEPAAAQKKGKKKVDWHVERDQLMQKIETRINAEVNKAVSKKGIAGRLHLKWPVSPPNKSKEAIGAAVEKQVDREVKKKFPESRFDEFRQEAERIHRVYERGDKVSFTIRGGQGPNSFVTGRLRETGDLRIHVGNRWILRTDMERDTLANFYPSISQEYIEDYVRRHTTAYKNQQESYAESQKETLFPRSFIQAGYVPKSRKLVKSCDPKNWVSKPEIVDHFHAELQKKKRKQIEGRITKEVFAANGYILVEENQEWMPEKIGMSVAEKLRDMMGSEEEGAGGEEDLFSVEGEEEEEEGEDLF